MTTIPVPAHLLSDAAEEGHARWRPRGYTLPSWVHFRPSSLQCSGRCTAVWRRIFKVKSKLPAWITVGLLGAACAASFVNMSSSNLSRFRWCAPSSSPTALNGSTSRRGLTGKGEAMHFVANFAFYIDSLTLPVDAVRDGLATLIALYASEYMATTWARVLPLLRGVQPVRLLDVVPGDGRQPAAALPGLGRRGPVLVPAHRVLLQEGSAVAAGKKAFIVNRIGDLVPGAGHDADFVHFGSVEYKRIFERPSRTSTLLGGPLAEILGGRAADPAAADGSARSASRPSCRCTSGSRTRWKARRRCRRSSTRPRW
jgi:hypothetical protein